MTITAYHVTSSDCAQKIIDDGYIPRVSDTHWLGQGVYFFESLNDAKYNAQSSSSIYGNDIIESKISCLESAIIDLDEHANLTAFRKFYNSMIGELKKSGVILAESDKRQAMRKYNCIMLDLFRVRYGIKVICRSFQVDMPTFGETLRLDEVGLSYSGIPYIERYVCVAESGIISSSTIVNCEEGAQS